jgi:hypothetical protein
MIKTTPKYTFSFSPMLLHRYWLRLTYPLSYFMRPAKRHRQKRHHLLQPLCLSQPRLLQAESSFLKTSEQSLDLPTPGVFFYSPPCRLSTCHYQVFSSSKLHPGDVKPLPDDTPPPFKLNRLAYSASGKQACGSHHLPSLVADYSIGSQTYAKIYTILFEVSEQLLANKLSISAQKVNRVKAEESVKFAQQSPPLGVIRAASLFKQNPKQRESNALVADAKREYVDRRRGEAPIGAINTQHPGGGLAQELNYKASNAAVADVKATQETLDTFVAGISRSRATESRSNLSEVDGPDLDESDEELSQEVDTSFVPGYIISKRSLKRANVGHCAISFQEHLEMNLIRIAARWPLCIFKELFLSCT